MRTLQLILFVLGVLSLAAALPFVGAVAGDALWRAGIAVLLLDVVCILLWARPPAAPDSRARRS